MKQNIITPKPNVNGIHPLTESEQHTLYNKIMKEASNVVKKMLTESGTISDDIDSRCSKILDEEFNITDKFRGVCAELADNVSDDIENLKLAIKEKEPDEQKKLLTNIGKHLSLYKKYLNKLAVLKSKK